VRDKRYDWIYQLQKQPVKQALLERFAADLGDEVAAWPPPDLEWESEALRTQWQAGAEARPRSQVVRFALELARLDVRREIEAFDQRVAAEAALHWQSLAERAAGLLLVRLLTERCLDLKERASGARLTREDLAQALDLVERRLFRVTLG
jgi:hypothetical protein